MQHAWATAVETVGLFVGQALKSSLGPNEWLDFFRLMSSGIAMLEGTSPVPDTPEDPYELSKGILHFVEALDVFDRLQGYSRALNIIEERPDENFHFFLVELSAVEQKTTIRAFSIGQSELATKEYADAEARSKDKPGEDVVLVSVDSLEQLRKAYPNYFADTRMFLQAVDEVLALGGVSQRPYLQ